MAAWSRVSSKQSTKPPTLSAFGGFADWDEKPPKVDIPYSDWDDELTERDHEDLRQTIRKLQPKFKPAGEQFFEHSIRTAVRKRLTTRNFSDSQLRPRDHELITSQAMNARLIFTEQPWALEREGAGGPGHVPKLIILSGHMGDGGNTGITGIYERYPDDFGGRPVYHKVMERGPNRDPSETRISHGAQASRRDSGASSPRSRASLDRSERVEALPPLPACKSSVELQVARHVWFLFFYQGFWQIGPKVGSKEAIARCPGSDIPIPSSLLSWEVWDARRKKFCKGRGLRAMKGGH